MKNAAKKMQAQLEEICAFEDDVTIQGRVGYGFEVTIHYFGPEGPTHFHTNGPTLPETVERALGKRRKMREEESSQLPGEGKGDVNA